MLIDNVTITIKAGNGGNGALSFLRNAQTPKGGPDGGNGGNGGDVYFEGKDDITALSEFTYKKSIKAEDGINGGKKNLYGRNGKDLVVKIPFGTEIKDLTNGKTYEILTGNERILIAKGGKGGRGNKEFRTSTDQAPRYREFGEKGEEVRIELNLKLIADIGLIGLPNAGKSSLLSKLTHAHPKIGNYPFTTLEPNLGVMDEIILADIPGLIEGASRGRGLGIKFLKHIEKTKILIHCIDSTEKNPLDAYNTVRKELETYSTILISKPEIILLTKSDLIDEKTLKKAINIFKKTGKKSESISIYNEESLNRLKNLILKNVKGLPK